MTNQAILIKTYGGPDAAIVSKIDMPQVATGHVIVRVRAAGINGLDWKVREGYLRDAFPLQLPVVLGLELAGEIAAVGTGSRFAVGDRVTGLVGGLGAFADYVALPETLLVPTPTSLSDIVAASLPVAGLTAWQMLRAAGDLIPGKHVLIHGASGGVGGLAVQMAKAAGLRVSATASASSGAHVARLGADLVIDRHAERFEELVGGVDLVLDLVGGDVVDRSWALLPDGGALVSSVRPDVAAGAPMNKRGLWFMMQPDGAALANVLQAVADGRLSATIAETVGLADLPAAIERNRTGHAPGKAVADFTLA
jgi:NADPH:quinone reductase-like Zn-dependent oxidoreductase